MKWRINNYSKKYHGVPGNFDVNLYIPRITPPVITANDDNCFGYLFITLKIFYEKDDEGKEVNIDTTKFRTIAWPDSAWTDYINKIKQLSTFWDGKFWLVLYEDKKRSPEYKNVERFIGLYDDFARHPVSGNRQIRVYGRTILCKFILEILDSSSGAHKHIKAAYIVDKNTNTPAGVDTYTNRSNDSYYDNGDVITYSPTGYNTIIHELGHAIGIPHIGVETNYAPCLAHDHFWDGEGANADQCYQGPLSSDIMGGGGSISWHDAIPWRFALQEMTGVPLQYYVVQQMPIVSNDSEIITEGTSRWAEFYN
jgi:hypothetical protein